MSGKTTKLLLVEDNPGDARLLREILLEADGSQFDLTHVERLDEAFKRLAAESFDVVLLDLLLPDSHGSETLLRLRAHSPQTPIVVLTGVEDESLGVQLVQEGAQDYLVKGKAGGESLARVIRYAIERQRAENALRESEERLRAVVESANVAIISGDSQGNIISWNEAAETIFGYTEDEVLGKPATILMPDAYIAPHQKGMEHKRLTGESRIGGQTVEMHGRRKDGSIFPTESSLSYWKTSKGLFSTIIIRDITERKRAEEALRESERRFRAILETLRLAAVALDVEGRITFCNDFLLELTGWQREQVIGQDWFEIFMPDPSMKSGFMKAIQSGTAPQYNEILTRQGERRLISWSDIILHDSQGQVIGIASIGEDITERKRAENALRESEERFRTVAQSANDAVIVADDSGTIVTWNKGAEKIFLYSEQEALGQPVSILMPEPYRSRHQEAAKRIHDGGAPRIIGKMYESCGLRKDGSEVPVEISLASWETAQHQYYSAMIRDITERKRAEEEILRNAARTEALLHIAARLNAELDLQAVSNAICEETAHALNVPAAVVSLYDEKSDLLSIRADFGLPREFRERHIPMSRTNYEQFTRALGTVNTIPDAQAMPGLPNAALCVALDIRTIAGASMILHEENLVGTLSIYTLREVRHFTADELTLLKGLADQAAQAISNAQLYEAEGRRTIRLMKILQLSIDLAILHDESALLNTLVTRAATIAESPACTVLLIDEGTNEAVLIAQSGLPEGTPPQLRIPLTLPIIRRSIESGEPIIIAHIDRDAPQMRRLLVKPEITSFFAYPMMREKQTIGFITLSSLTPHTPSDSEITAYRLLADRAAAALENTRLLEKTERHLKQVQALHTIDAAITASMDLRLTLKIFLDEALAQLRVDAAAVLTLNPHTQTLDYITGSGFRTTSIEHSHLRFGQGIAGRAAYQRRRISSAELSETNGTPHNSLLKDESFVASYAVPLIAKGQIKGVLEIFNRTPLNPDDEWLEFLETLAGQAAIAIDNATLFEGLQRSNAELMQAYDATIEGWSRALDLRDKETEGHTQRVTEMALKLARAIGLSETELMHIRRGALLHDMGKMGVPDSILLKPDTLTDDEWIIMRRHPQLAYEMLSPIAFLKPALDIPYCHHEKWDGTGYPRSLKGEQIPLAARLFAIVDVWDALRSDRPYRASWSEEKVRQYIREQSGKHFDPMVVEVFLNNDPFSS